MMIFQSNNPLNKPRFKYFPCSTRDMLPFSLVLWLVLMSLLINRNDCKRKCRLSQNISASAMVENAIMSKYVLAHNHSLIILPLGGDSMNRGHSLFISMYLARESPFGGGFQEAVKGLSEPHCHLWQLCR